MRTMPAADPGFHRGLNGAPGCQPIIWPNFLENSKKMKKIGPGARPKFYGVESPLYTFTTNGGMVDSNHNSVTFA